MPFRRLSFVAGWAAVALLAVAGFAAFGNTSPTAEQVQVEAAAASMGHTAGAYAGLYFALVGSGDPPPHLPGIESRPLDLDGFTLTERGAAEVPGEEEPAESGSGGTMASPISGWLSQVEVRALVSLYFEPEDVNRAIRVAWCESRFDPNSVDLRTGGIGLFQHLPQYWDERAAKAGFAGTDPTDPEASVAAAAWEVYNGAGWDVFTCRG